MMSAVLTTIGAFIGYLVGELGGAVVGGTLGYLLGDRFDLKRQIRDIHDRMDELKRRLRRTDDELSQRREPAVTRSQAQGPAEKREAAEDQARAPTDAEMPGTETAPLPAVKIPPRAVAEGKVSEPAGRSPGWPSDFQRPGSRAEKMDTELPIVRWLRLWFTTGNLVVKIGALILFIGVAFLVKYAAERTRVPIELRLAGVAVGAVALLAFGWWLRQRQRSYSLVLQGVAVAVLYLVVFASLRLYSLVPPGAAFLLLAALGVFTAVLAIVQNAQVLAMMGIAGGFLAPILTSTGEGSHVVLFSYFALLDAGILAIAWFKSWRTLNLLGFAFTFGIGTAWGVLRYEPQQLASTEPFLVLFFLFFCAIAVIFAFRQAPRFTHYVDGTLVFGTPVIAFALQSGLVHDIPYALAYSAVVASAFYIALAWFLHRRQQPNLRLLVEAFLALGVAFATLAVPLALDGRWTAATWALEGAAILWVGIRQQRLLARVSGVLLQLGGGVAYYLSSVRAPELLPIFNSHFVGSVLLSIAGIAGSRLIVTNEEQLHDGERPFGPTLFFWGLAWWLFAGMAEVTHAIPEEYEAGGLLAFLALTALGLGFLATRLSWKLPRYPALCLLPVMVFFACAWLMEEWHFLARGGFVAWPLAVGIFYFLLRRHESQVPTLARNLLHAAGAWLIALLVSGELAWVLEDQLGLGGAWVMVPWLVVPAALLFILVRSPGSSRWPLGMHVSAYFGTAAPGLQIYLLVTLLVSSLASRGNAAPLPYIPVINPLDIAQGFAFLAIFTAMVRQRVAGLPEFATKDPRTAIAAAAIVLFAALNAAVLRTLHHWAGIPFNFEAMAGSTLVQSTLSIFWTLVALGTMWWGTRRRQRIAWIAGAALMGVVVIKLMLVDLSSVGTVARIVSFVVVGLLMLLLGNYLRMPSATPSVART